MSYFSTDSGGHVEFGCGPGCSCRGCRTAASNLAQVYEEEEIPARAQPIDEPSIGPWSGRPYLPPRSPAQARNRFAGPFSRRRNGMYIRTNSGLGDPPPRTPWRARVSLEPQPQYLTFITLDQFNWNEASLTPRLMQMVKQLAEHVRVSWKSMRPIGYVRLIGHTDNTGPENYNIDLGDRRARTVKAALEDLLKDDILTGRVRIAILVEPSPG